MYCEWSGSRVYLYDEYRRLYRSFNVRYPVQCATVSGEGGEARVSITLQNSHTCLYKGNGQVIRA